MSQLTQGIIVFFIFTLVTGVAMAFAIIRAKKEDPNAPLLPKLIPFIVADGLFVMVFIAWFISQ